MTASSRLAEFACTVRICVCADVCVCVCVCLRLLIALSEWFHCRQWATFRRTNWQLTLPLYARAPPAASATVATPQEQHPIRIRISIPTPFQSVQASSCILMGFFNLPHMSLPLKRTRDIHIEYIYTCICRRTPCCTLQLSSCLNLSLPT